MYRTMMNQSRADSRKLDASELGVLLAEWSDGGGALYARLTQSIGRLVDAGVLRAGHRLPPERALAEALNVSRGTVVRAYDTLAERGTVARVQGSGTTVNGHEFSSDRADMIGERLWADAGSMVDFLKAIPTVSDQVLDLIDKTDLRSLGSDLDTAEPLGLWSLRTAIADRYSASGLTTNPNQIMVTTGAQQVLSIVVQGLVRPGDVVLGEEQTWPGLIDVVSLHGARYQSVRMDGDGVDPVDLEQQLKRFAPALIALNPQFHNPTGTCLPQERVEQVADLARRYRVPLLEDRVSASLGFDGRPRPALATFDADGQAMIADSLCKVTWPGIRLGWLRADAQLIHRFRTAKAVSDMFTSPLSQAAALTLMDHLDELTAARVTQLRARADVVVDGLRRYLPEWRFVPPRGGLSVWAELPSDASAEAFSRHAMAHGVQLASCGSFTADEGTVGHVRLPFTAHESVLAEGMRRIAEAWGSFDPTQPAATGVM